MYCVVSRESVKRNAKNEEERIGRKILTAFGRTVWLAAYRKTIRNKLPKIWSLRKRRHFFFLACPPIILHLTFPTGVVPHLILILPTLCRFAIHG